MIYELKFSYYEDNSENNDEIIIAVYSSYKKAEIGKKKFSQQPRFKGKEEFLEINEYKINEAEWNEGFWRATKSYFIIKKGRILRNKQCILHIIRIVKLHLNL